MKLKRPNISNGPWTKLDDPTGFGVSDSDGNWIATIHGGRDEDEPEATAIAALPEVMDLLEGIVAKAVRYVEDPKGQTRALFQIEGMANEAMLKMGYTEEKEDEACDECGREIPIANGGSLSNKHHAKSCSLYDPTLP